jgi:hypothetical protein
MKYIVKNDQGAMIYIRNFIKIGLAIQNLVEEDRETDIVFEHD